MKILHGMLSLACIYGALCSALLMHREFMAGNGPFVVFWTFFLVMNIINAIRMYRKVVA